MPKKMIVVGRIVVVALGLVLFAGGADAQWRGRRPDRNADRDFHRFSLSMEGGFGELEHGRGMVDLKIEAQVGITRELRLGLGLGFMDRGRGHEGEMDRDGRRYSWSSYPYAEAGSQAGTVKDFRVLPLSLNVTYALPLGRRLNAFMSAGGSYFFGTFEGPAGHQTENAWGGQAGLGIEYRITPRISLIADGSYRVAEFRGLKVVQAKPRLPIMDAFQNRLRSLNLRTPVLGRIVQNFMRSMEALISPPAPKRVDLDFNGFSLRAGVKFGI